MTVKQLIKKLQELPPDSQVVIQRDSEGNGYSPLCGIDGDVIYRPDNSYSGEVFSTKYSADDAGFDSEEEWEEFKNTNPRCCVVYPSY